MSDLGHCHGVAAKGRRKDKEERAKPPSQWRLCVGKNAATAAFRDMLQDQGSESTGHGCVPIDGFESGLRGSL